MMPEAGRLLRATLKNVAAESSVRIREAAPAIGIWGFDVHQ
jgi:hypothetical protein